MLAAGPCAKATTDRATDRPFLPPLFAARRNYINFPWVGWRMAVGLGSVFLNPAGLATALILIPFLLLYLIKPKPRHETVPSLLFVMKDLGKSNISSFFRSFLRDLLLLLIGAAAKPFINVSQRYLAEQTVLVVDVSASMHADNDGRFKQAISLAKENIGKENTIILIDSSPSVLAERVSGSAAKDALDALRPTDTTTDISDALQLARSYATTGSRVIVISDFLPTAGDKDYKTVADALESTGAIVDYLPVTGGSSNVGIIDLAVGPVTSSVWLKNTDPRPAQVTLKISDAAQQVLLGPGETKEITFNTPPGVAKLQIAEGDDLLADNTAWTSAPDKNTVKALVITNSQDAVQRSNLLLALNVIGKNFPMTFDITYAQPPKIPSLDGYDVYIIDQTNLDLMLPGYIRDIKDKVSSGAALIVFAQPALFSMDWQGLLPVTPQQDVAGSRSSVLPATVSSLTQDVDFGQVSAYTRVQSVAGATLVAKTAQDPIIVLGAIGKGHVLYYGIDDTQGSFSRDPSYPVFWRRAFDLLTNRPSLENLNLHTGMVLTLPSAIPVKTPIGTVTANIIPLDYAGLYTLPDRTIAVNLLSDGESQIASPGNVTAAASSLDSGTAAEGPLDLSDYVLWLAIAFLLLEILYLKYRGDL